MRYRATWWGLGAIGGHFLVCCSSSTPADTAVDGSALPTSAADTATAAPPGASTTAAAPSAAATGAASVTAIATDVVDASVPPPDAPDSASSQPTNSSASDAAVPVIPDVHLPPANGDLDYQLGGAYTPPMGVVTVSRDRTAQPAAGLYSICYVNGFQVQPGEEGDWDSELLLVDDMGELVIDPDWDEVLLDTSSAEKRAGIAAVVGDWIEQCGLDGFDAVEIDNLDTYTRSDGALTEDGAVQLIALLSERAHRHGLAIAQKNSVELVARKAEMGTDFVVAEECNTYDECDGYMDGYGQHVLMIEYLEADFTKGCAAYGADYGIVLRDLDLTPAGNGAYIFDGC